MPRKTNLYAALLDRLPEVDPKYASNLYFRAMMQQPTNGELERIELTKDVITICSANCGDFNAIYTNSSEEDSSLPPEITLDEWLRRWRKMINDTRFDMFCVNNWTEYFDYGFGTQNIIAQEVLFDDIVKEHFVDPINSMTNSLRCQTRIPMEEIGILEVTRYYTHTDGETYQAHRRYALKTKIFLGGREVVIYTLHFVPGSTGGWPGAFRAIQFTDLMNDAQQYENVIFIGDFNTHNISEMEIFTNNGYKIGNGGYTGSHPTLRGMPIDNVVVSPNLNIDYFKVMDDYALNSDHLPFISQVRYIGE